MFDQLDLARTNTKLDLFVVQSELMQDSRQPIVMMDNSFHRMVRKLIGSTVDVPCLKAATRHPLAKAVRIVVAADFVTFVQSFAKLNHAP